MSVPQGRAIRLGLFTLLGLAVLVALLVAVFGSRLFATTDRAVLRFSTTVQGLQVGGPVVLRGVRVGNVRSIDIETNAADGRFEVPVVVEIDRAQLRDLNPQGGHDLNGSLERLVAYGLQGQLQLQSILTGQLYVDLDMRTAAGGQPLVQQAVRRTQGGLVEIPTRPSKLQSLQQQLENVDFGKMANDLTTLVNTTRQLVASPALKQALDDIAAASASVRSVAAVVDRRLPAMADSIQGALKEARTMTVRVTETTANLKSASDRTGAAADRTGAAADRIRVAAQQATELLKPDSPMLSSLTRTSEDLARTARSLERMMAEDAQTMQALEGTLRDVGRASRAVRELSDLLEAHPDVLLRGRRDDGMAREAAPPPPAREGRDNR